MNPYQPVVERLTSRVEHYGRLAKTRERELADLCRCAETQDLCTCGKPLTTYGAIVERESRLLALAKSNAAEWAACNPTHKENA